jgi:ClpP class serine protease
MDFSRSYGFLIISSLQPVIRQRLLESSRLRVLRQLEQQRNSRVVLMIHRQETMSFLGFPLMRYIDINDVEAVLRAIKLTDDNVPIDLILHTPGGLVLAAARRELITTRCAGSARPPRSISRLWRHIARSSIA